MYPPYYPCNKARFLTLASHGRITPLPHSFSVRVAHIEQTQSASPRVATWLVREKSQTQLGSSNLFPDFSHFQSEKRACCFKDQVSLPLLGPLCPPEVMYLRKKPAQRKANKDKRRGTLSLWIWPGLISFSDF